MRFDVPYSNYEEEGYGPSELHVGFVTDFVGTEIDEHTD